MSDFQIDIYFNDHRHFIEIAVLIQKIDKLKLVDFLNYSFLFPRQINIHGIMVDGFDIF